MRKTQFILIEEFSSVDVSLRKNAFQAILTKYVQQSSLNPFSEFDGLEPNSSESPSCI
jgi:hypothetical protein